MSKIAYKIANGKTTPVYILKSAQGDYDEFIDIPNPEEDERQEQIKQAMKAKARTDIMAIFNGWDGTSIDQLRSQLAALENMPYDVTIGGGGNVSSYSTDDSARLGEETTDLLDPDIITEIITEDLDTLVGTKGVKDFFLYSLFPDMYR